MKLNLGCGKDYRVGWVNIDIDESIKADCHQDIRHIEVCYAYHNAEYILLNHVFEHLTFIDGQVLLHNLHSILKKDGTLEIAVPDLAQAMKEELEGVYTMGEAPAIERIYGNQSTFYELHKSGYTKESLTKLLTRYNFTIVEDLSTPTEIRFKCKKLERVDERV